MEKLRIYLFIATFVFAIFSSVIVFQTAGRFNSDKSLSLLAGQFAKGHISLEPTDELPLGDLAFYDGRYYMYFGPLASIILIPFVIIFGTNFPQTAIGVGSMAISFYAVFKISRSFKFSKIDSLWLCLFFVFSTVLFSSSAINITAYLVEALGVPLMLLSLAEYFNKKRPILIGLFLGLAVLTRLTLILAVLFFVIEFLQKRLTRREFIIILIPVGLCCFLFGAYNYIRFDSFIETGYNLLRNVSFPLSKNYEHGAVSLIHIPANLYSFLIMPPDPILYFDKGFVFKFPYFQANPWGMAIWFTSPLFLLLFRFKRGAHTLAAAVASVAVAIPLFTYFSVGFAQFGYRYALDFLPFLFLILMPILKPKLSRSAIFLIILGVVFNCIYITSPWGVYPLLGIN